MRRLIWFVSRLYPAAWRARYGVEFQALVEDVSPGFGDIFDILRGALQMQLAGWNFWKVAAVFGLAGTLAGAVLSFALPKNYISTAVMRLTSNSDGSQRVNILAQAALSRRSLDAVIKEERLYEPLRAKMPMEDVIERMKRDVQIGRVTANAFTISFIYPDPAAAQRTARALADKLISQNLSTPTGDGSSASLSVLDPPAIQKDPISPNQAVVTGCGLAVGVLVGLSGWAMARRRIRTSGT